MAVVFEKTKMLTDTVFHYCPGCTHGIAHRLVGEAIEELRSVRGQDHRRRAGRLFACFAYNYFNCDMIRGRARPRPRRRHRHQARRTPDNLRLHLPGRRRPRLHRHGRDRPRRRTGARSITVIFINNAIYGMTGGQMAPTTPDRPEDHRPRPYGRSEEWCGLPIKVCEMLSQLPGTVLCRARRRATPPPTSVKAKKAITKAFQIPDGGQGLLAWSRCSPPAPPTGA